MKLILLLKDRALTPVRLLRGLTIVFLFSQIGFSYAETVIVEGLRGENRSLKRAGKSTVFSPNEANRVNTSEQLKKESSVVLPDTGKPSASGFVVPRIRGQDARFTEVWFEDVQLQDPYSGLPLVDSIDLRAFGLLELHSGLAPASMLTTSPSGAIRYRMPQSAQPGLSNSLGITGGDISGTSVWALSQHVNRDQRSLARIYTRHHEANGKFKYYDSNGTPYNVSDDFTATRKNNSTRSSQALPWLVWTNDSDRITFLGWIHQNWNQIPASSGKTAATETDTGHLGRLKWQREIFSENVLVPKSVHLTIGATNDSRKLRDSERTILLNSSQNNFQNNVIMGALGSTWDSDFCRIFAETGSSNSTFAARTESNKLLAGKRVSNTANLAGELEVLKFRNETKITLEPKISIRETSDRLKTLNDRFGRPNVVGDRITHRTYGSGITLGYLSEPLQAWLQAGRHQRSASVLERFGDGSSIIGNLELKPERMNHYEIGSRLIPFNVKSTEFELVYFANFAEDRIVIIPANATTHTVTNIGKSEVRGIESRIQYNWDSGLLGIGITKIYSREQSGENEPGVTNISTRQLPGVSPLYSTLNLTQEVIGFKLLTSVRYRDRIWRDQANQIAVPAVTIFDIGANTGFRVMKSKVSWGVTVLNVANTRRVEVSAPNTNSSKGFTAYSEVDGSPLPGRQIKTELSTEF